ncbi:DMT family transporter [Actibacterium pelagium]|uniref:Transporter n=1 Tax=Actibacterium pelagium TaxID=2029103 RepID=A0A917EGN2_9RHOB|nr:DMT family transporter [Actibacterium pelagium]GGE41133.1 transporter [Actibacterium pelagium]
MPDRIKAIFLLLYTGGLFGLTFPLSKLAAAAGVPPLLWAMVLSAGGAGLILPALILRGGIALPRGQMLRYTLISGAVSFALVNFVITVLVPRVGAGQVSLVAALSPVATLGLSVVFGLKGPGFLGVAGILFGLIGAGLVTLGKGGVDAVDLWSLAALGLPAILASGNIYRTLDWPKGAHPLALAFWSHSFALIPLVGLQFVLYGGVPAGQLFEGQLIWVTLVQFLAAGMTFPAYFRLQELGGPVMLSQIAYVSAAIGLGSGSLFLAEVYPPLTWIGALIIAVGIGLTILTQMRPNLRMIHRASA